MIDRMTHAPQTAQVMGLVALELAGLKSSNRTRGHFIHSPAEFEVGSFEEYRRLLQEHCVVLEPEERKKSIERQFEEKLAGRQAEVYSDETLLERLLWNVECPLIIMGNFPETIWSCPWRFCLRP